MMRLTYPEFFSYLGDQGLYTPSYVTILTITFIMVLAPTLIFVGNLPFIIMPTTTFLIVATLPMIVKVFKAHVLVTIVSALIIRVMTAPILIPAAGPIPSIVISSFTSAVLFPAITTLLVVISYFTSALISPTIMTLPAVISPCVMSVVMFTMFFVGL